MIDKTAFPSDTADKVLVRMPDGMRDQLKAAAKASNRTMNAEIVARLQASLEEPAQGEALTISTADAVHLLLKKVEGIEARLIQPEGASLLKTGTPTVQQSSGVEGLTRRK